MLFTDMVFPFFVILTLLCFALARHHPRAQLGVFLAASYIFYGWWDVRFLSLIVFSSCVDFMTGRLIDATEDARKRRRYLFISLTCNLGLLGYFKYAGFFVDSFVAALGGVGLGVDRPVLDIVLPVGISFYTFQTLSYTFDIYLRRMRPTQSLLEFMVFVAAFPQLVAGPIVRARDLLPQLKQNLFERSETRGIFYIAYGLSKKIFVADVLGRTIVDKVYAAPDAASSLDTLFAIYAFAFQLFLDFSAYSDIALGLGLIFGMSLPVNFRSPYHAANPAEFWQRWHITLSTWFRDYLYIPLSVSRVSALANYRNLFIVFVLSGLWHGAGWTFVIWGVLHGAMIVVHRFWLDRRRTRGLSTAPASGLRRVVHIVICFHAVALVTVVFRAPDMAVVGEVFASLFASTGGSTLMTPHTLGVFALGLIFHSLGDPRLARWAEAFGRAHWGLQGAALYASVAAFAYFGRAGIINQAFIYYQF